MNNSNSNIASKTPIVAGVNLASAKLGAQAVACSDDFFADMSRMLNDAAPVFIDGKYDDHGKWMDGWESRRKRTPGNDWCIVKLARAGVVSAVTLDTAYFTGNYPEAASIQACFIHDGQSLDDAKWVDLLLKTELKGDAIHDFKINHADVFSHLKLNIFPDGGVARLRVYGQPQVDWQKLKGQQIDIAAALNGAVGLKASDEHFGTLNNILMPGRGCDMGDGWETRRRRGPGNDWSVIALAHAGTIQKIEIDTAHFKGNYPDSCSITGANLSSLDIDHAEQISETWTTLLPQVKLKQDAIHTFSEQISLDIGAVSHIRLNIFPDGGISRIRLHAKI